MDLSNIVITTDRIRLVPVTEEFAKNIFEEFTSEVTTYMHPKAPSTIADTLDFIKRSQEALAKKERLMVAILHIKTNEFLGGAGIVNINTNTPELGIWIKKSAHGHKYGREAVKGLKEWAEEHLTYEYLTYPVDKRNIPSRKIAESLGGIIAKEYTKINESGNTLDDVEYWIYK